MKTKKCGLIFTKQFLNKARKLIINAMSNNFNFNKRDIQVVDEIDGYTRYMIEASMSLEHDTRLTKSHPLIMTFAAYLSAEIREYKYFWKLEAHPSCCVATDDACDFPIRIHTLEGANGAGMVVSVGLYKKTKEIYCGTISKELKNETQKTDELGNPIGIEVKDIPGYERLYAITRDGRVWRYPRMWVGANGSQVQRAGKWLSRRYSTSRNRSWRGEQIMLCKDGIIEVLIVPRLVALLYIKDQEEKKYVCHVDRNTTNNHVNNLRWSNNKNSFNEYAMKKGKITHQLKIKQYKKDGAYIKTWSFISEASMQIIIFDICIKYVKLVYIKQH